MSPLTALLAHDAPAIVNLINANPSWETINDLAYAFPDAAASHPSQVDQFAATLVAVRDSPDIPSTIHYNDSFGNLSQANFRSTFKHCIYDMLTTAFGYLEAEVDSRIVIYPQNRFLLSAMISGACVRSDLCHSAAQAGKVTCGLQLPGTDHELYFTPKEAEINALHACLQLLVGGTLMYTTQQVSYRQNEVLPALLSLKGRDVVQNINGKELLEVTIEQAKSDFVRNIPVSDIWRILFPAQAA